MLVFSVIVLFRLKDYTPDNVILFTVTKSHEKIKTNNELIWQVLSEQPKPDIA